MINLLSYNSVNTNEIIVHFLKVHRRQIFVKKTSEQPDSPYQLLNIVSAAILPKSICVMSKLCLNKISFCICKWCPYREVGCYHTEYLDGGTTAFENGYICSIQGF